MKLADLFVKLKLKKNGFDSGIQQAEQKTRGFGSVLKKVGGAIAGLFAVKAIINWSNKMLAAYDKQAKAESELLVALKGRKIATKELIEQAGQLQKKTLFGDEETIHADALIAAFVKEKDQIKQIIPLVQDFAAAKRMNLAAAADLVSKTLGSSTNALTRYGIVVKGAVGSNERLQSTIKGLSDAFKGQAAAAAEAGTGGLKQLSNLWGDMKERIGKLIYQGIKPLIPALKAMLTPTNDVIGSLEKEKEQANLLVIQLTNTNTSAKERNRIYQILKTQYPDILKGINQEKIDVKKLADNLDHYNKSMLRKIMMEQQNEKLNKLIKTEGEVKISRAKKELDLSKSLLDDIPQFARFDKERAKKAKEILGTNADIYDKYKQISDLVGASMSEGKYTTANFNWNKIANLAYELVQLRKDEADATKNVNDETKKTAQIYQKIFNVKDGSKQLTLDQRNAIDDYNRTMGTTLDYSKELTDEQKKQLKLAKGGGKSNVKDSVSELGALKIAVSDAKKAYTDFMNKSGQFHGEVDAQSFLDKMNQLRDAIKKAEKALADFQQKDLSTNYNLPIDSLTPKTIKGGVAVELTPTLKIDPSKLKKGTDEFANLIQHTAGSFSEEINNFLRQQMGVISNELGEDLGNMLAGVTPPKDFGKEALIIVGDFIKQMGELLIGYAINMAVIAVNIGNPGAWPLVLAAGVALVAIGTAISATAKKGLSGGGVASPSTYAPASGYTNYSSSSGGSILDGNVTFKLEGTMLKGVLNNVATKNYLIR